MHQHINQIINRRAMLAQCGAGMGTLALATLLADDGLLAGESGEADKRPQGTAKHVIFLFMSGAPSQVDTFDPKPLLGKLDGQDVPESIAEHVPRIKRSGLKNLMASPFKFQPYGESGIPVSELLPHTARQVDDLCVIRSLAHRNPVHGPAECITLTGTQVGDRPSLGSWLTYGLGSENESLPSFVVMNANSSAMQFPQAAGWSAGFLPARHQGTVVEQSGIRNVRMPAEYTDASRRRQLELMEFLNRRHMEKLGDNSELEARIRSYELAFRMQAAAPEVFDLGKETQQTKEMYGIGNKTTGEMAARCLTARRLVEAGVRFVQIRLGGWDAHANLTGNHSNMCARSDQPIAALLADLKQRNLLDETLVVWGGEFGRTPTMEGKGKGRDHSPGGYVTWLAGGGIRGGQIIGQTDEIGYTPVERPLRPSDLHATILHALGIDQYKLFYDHHGRKELVTVLGGEVIREAFG
jgi:hypothetical protein